MKCHYCDTELNGNEVYCRNCGTRQQSELQEEPVEAVAPEELTPVYEEPTETDVPVAPAAVPSPRPAPVYQEKTFDWHPYGAPAPAATLFDFENSALPKAPKLQLPTRRGLLKMIFFSILTFGIYPIVIWSRLVGEVNMVASRYDGERSMSFFGMTLLAPFTLGIHSLVWTHKLCRRIGAELQRRNINYNFGAKDFWLWNMLLAFLSGICSGIASSLYIYGYRNEVVLWVLTAVGALALVGPFIFIHKLMRSMNKMNAHFNTNG